MRALSLTAVAALVLLAACSDATAPPEAVDAQFAAATPSSPEIFNEWIPSTPYVFDGCGETFTYEGGMDHLIIREHVTPSGKYRWNYHIQTSAAMITSTSGGIDPGKRRHGQRVDSGRHRRRKERLDADGHNHC